MRVSRILLIVLFVATSATAEDATKKKAEEPGTHVQMPFLIAPMSVDGKLQGYAYINSKLVASTPAASVEIRDKLAFIQDAFVREVNGAPVGKANDPTTVDEPALANRLTADARQIVGAAKVVTITFTQIQFSPLHPKATTEDAIPPSERATPPAAMVAPAPAKAKTP